MGLIIARFFMVREYVAFSSFNAKEYTNFAFWNAILPFVVVGIPMGQNAVFPKLSRNKKDSLAEFYKIFLIFGSMLALSIFLLNNYFNAYTILSYSFIQLFINIAIQQIRYDKPYFALLIIMFEMIFITFMILQENIITFEVIFKYYSFVLLIVSLFRLRDVKSNLGYILEARHWLFNLKALIFRSPLLIREHIDVILIGIFFLESFGGTYALIILCVAPLRIILSNIISASNFYLARSNKYYSSFDFRLQYIVLLFATFIGIMTSILIGRYLFDVTDLEIFGVIVIKVINTSLNNYHNIKFLDAIQAKQKEVDYINVIKPVIIGIILSILIVNLFPSILIISACGFIFGIVSRKIYN